MKSRFIFCLVVLVFISFSMVTFCVCKVDKTYALSFLEGTLNVKGFMRNDSAWRIRHGSNAQEGLEPWDLILCRNTFQLEIEYKPTDWLTVFAIPRLVYDASLDLDRSLERRIASHARHDFKVEDDLREIYADIVWNNWRARIGKQQIMWGESDLFRMADIVNPLDISWDYLLYSTVSSFEDIRIPLWALDLNWASYTGYQWSVEFVWLPGFIEDGFEPHKVAPEGANWALPGTPQFMVDSLRTSEPDDGWENSEFGLRVKGIFRGWETALFYFYSRMDHPTPKEDVEQRLLRSVNFDHHGHGEALIPGVGLYAHPGKYFEYPFTNRMGATFNKYHELTKTIYRGECVVTIDEPMIDRYVMDRTYERETFQYMLGFDRPTMIRFLNPNRSFLISAQLFQKFIFNYNHHMKDHSPGGTTTDRYQTVLTFLINTGYRWDTILPQLLLAYNFSGEGAILPQCEFWIGDHWRLGVGAHIMMSHNMREPYFGGFRHNDQLYTWLKYQFH